MTRLTPIRLGWHCVVTGDKHTIYLSAAKSLMFTPMCCGRWMEPLDPDQWEALDAARLEADKALRPFGVTVATLLVDAMAGAYGG